MATTHGRVRSVRGVASLQLGQLGDYLGIVADWEPLAHNASEVMAYMPLFSPTASHRNGRHLSASCHVMTTVIS